MKMVCEISGKHGHKKVCFLCAFFVSVRNIHVHQLEITIQITGIVNISLIRVFSLVTNVRSYITFLDAI